MADDIQVKVLLKEGNEEWDVYSQVTFSAMAERFERAALLNNSTVILWDHDTSGNMGSFDLLMIKTDVVVDIELTTQDGDANEEIASFRLMPNTPFVLGADDSYYNHAASDAFAGTLGLVQRIRAIELNSVNATVELRAWKA